MKLLSGTSDTADTVLNEILTEKEANLMLLGGNTKIDIISSDIFYALVDDTTTIKVIFEVIKNV